MTRPISRAETIFLALADLISDERDAFLRSTAARIRSSARRSGNAAGDRCHRRRIPRSSEASFSRHGCRRQTASTRHSLEQWFVLHAIGSGGVGVVYAAQQEHPRRTVAIKVLRHGFRRPEILKRFEREAELLGRLQHPGVAQVFAFARGNRRVPAHLVMELVTGPPITEYVDAQALDYAAPIELMWRCATQWQHAHDRGIIHRPEAGQCAGFRRWPTEDPRLRHRARNGTRRRFDPANRPRRTPRHRPLHEPRAFAWCDGRSRRP
jgi:Protein kinase domain